MVDLISRSYILNIIEMWMKVPSYSESERNIMRAIDYEVRTAPSAEPGWVPVTERLPEKGGWYLVTWEDQFKTVRGVTVSEFCEPKGLTDIGHFEGFVLREIIAWMPLPEPYKEADG